MSFYDDLQVYQQRVVEYKNRPVTEAQIHQAIYGQRRGFFDFWTLLSPEAGGYLEEMAQVAKGVTLQHFGKTVLLFTPLYLSNYCINRCVYCGYSTLNQIQRRKLTLKEVEQEAIAIAETGLKHILILTGEAPKETPVSYIKDCVEVLGKYFPSISIEIYALTREEYKELIAVGVDGLTMFQEVYNETLYGALHLAGPKQNFRFRLEAPERAGHAGMRTIGIGALLGLDEWQTEAFLTGVHANYLQEKFPEAELSISLPRMCPHFGGYQPNSPVSERQLVQIMLATRLFLPRVGITISTRERAGFRDHLIGLGATKISAGVSTAVGGHAVSYQGDTAQFEIADPRSVAEIQQAITDLGYKPLLKDWHNLESLV